MDSPLARGIVQFPSINPREFGTKMLSWQSFVVDQVQASVFLADRTNFNSAKAATVMLGQYAQRFDGELESRGFQIELPIDLPFPQMTLKSASKEWQLNLSPGRLDAIWSRKEESAVLTLDEAAAACTEMVVHYVRETGSPISRLALVVNRRCDVENPAQVLIERFCNEASRLEPLNRSANFELHNHKLYSPDANASFRLNSWVRCKSGTGSSGRPAHVRVIQDLNTVVTDGGDRQITLEQAVSFFALVRTEADDIIGKYFPARMES